MRDILALVEIYSFLRYYLLCDYKKLCIEFSLGEIMKITSNFATPRFGNSAEKNAQNVNFDATQKPKKEKKYVEYGQKNGNFSAQLLLFL